jgi:hypothetical protein
LRGSGIGGVSASALRPRVVFLPTTYGKVRSGGVFHHVTSPPLEVPLARAEAHLQAGRVAQAAGAYRAILLIDPTAAQAHLGLAECTLARGSTVDAVQGLVRAATELGAGGHEEAALHLLAGALTVDPARLELHVDVAQLEIAAGHDDVATMRLRALAAAYRCAGRSEDAAAIEEFVGEDGAPTQPLPTDDSLVVALPHVSDDDALQSSSGSARNRLRRNAIRWQPGGSPGRRPPPAPAPRVAVTRVRPARPLPLPSRDVPSAAPTASPPPVPNRVVPPPVGASPRRRTAAPPAPSPLAQRLRTRSAQVQSLPRQTTAQDPKQRLAARLANVTAKHKPHLRPPSHGTHAAGPLTTASDMFEEERTRLFRR